MKPTTTYFFFFISIFVFSQHQFERAVILDSIPIGNTKKETFAIYLPTTYNQRKESSIVFIFEPSAKGKKGIKPFIKASEKYGHILVCSNNSKNGSYDKNFEIFNNLSYHIHSNFKIKKDEMFLGGFSGGSRLASAIANITDAFYGVIACGAGFPQVQTPECRPSSQKYNYVGLCGNRDFNYDEMTKNKYILDKLNFKNTLITYKGKHSWPKEDEILRAFDWIQLKILKRNNAPINKKEITELYEANYDKTFNYQKNNELIFAFENYQRILESYSPFLKLDSLRLKFNELKESKSYKKQKKSLQDIFKTEKETKNKLLGQFMMNIKNPNDNNLIWWEKQLKKLKKMEDSDNIDIQNMSFRIKYNVFVGIFSTIKFNAKDLTKKQQNYIHKLLNVIDPKFYKKTKPIMKNTL